MSEDKERKDHMSISIESGAKKAGEVVANRALNYVIDKVKAKYSEKQIEIGTVFERYLDNATNRINKVKTLATGNDPRNIIGENELYVKIGVEYKEDEVDTSSVENLIEYGDNILILGSGGVGKSMLMRYLFLHTAYYGNYIPVFVELRKISYQTAGNVSIIELIKECMRQFDVELPEDEFVYSLRLGKYLFLFDGFDEVRDESALEAADKIQEFCAKYPNNKCIMTSRNDDKCHPLQTFIYMHSMPLRKEQAIELASKLWEKDEKTVEFCKQLDEELFEKHESFSENPLLLSMMFLTFMRNISIPDHLAEFYKKAYEALYSLHDNHDKGIYRRDFKCDYLDEQQFRLLFARFCFQTHFYQIYEFKESEILDYIQESVDFLKYDIDKRNYLADLKNAVCMIVKEGTVYRFAHRSFQAYFAAVYTSEKLDDEKQKCLFMGFIKANFINWLDYFDLLNQIEHERFTKNALEDGLRELQQKVDESGDSDVYFLNELYTGIEIDYQTYNSYSVYFYSSIIGRSSIKLVDAFTNYVLNDSLKFSFKVKYEDNDYIFLTKTMEFIASNLRINDEYNNIRHTYDAEFKEIDKLNEDDKKRFYDILIKYAGIPLLREKIREWLKKLDDERENLSKNGNKGYIKNF